MDNPAITPSATPRPFTKQEMAGNIAKTLYFPVTKTTGKMWEYKKTTAVIGLVNLF